MASHISSGLFMVEIDWSDPRFAPWDISKLDLDDTQRDALLNDDEVPHTELTEQQQIELCLKVPCRVELNHSNVCYGVEKSWPYKMFKKSDFQSLRPKEQRKIYRDMERKAVLLHDTYVSAERLEERRRKRSNRALAPYLEEIFRKNQFLHIKALAEPAPGYDAVINESTLEIDSEAEADESLQTVINTGQSRNTQQSNKSTGEKEATDFNDNDFVANDESIGNEVEIESEMHYNIDDWQSEYAYSTTTVANVSFHKIDISEDTDDDFDGESEYRNAISDIGFVDILSESIVSSSVNEHDKQSEERSGCVTPRIDSNEYSLVGNTPALSELIRTRARGVVQDLMTVDDDDDEESEEVDSIDFLSQVMIGRTSTQQQQSQQV